MPVQSAKSVIAGATPGQPLSPIKGEGKGKNKANFDLAALRGEQLQGGKDRKGGAVSDKVGRGLDAGRTLDSGRPQENGRGLETGRTPERREATLAKFELLVLREGSRDKQVSLAQRSLNALGYNGCKPDGEFGPKTTETVRSFQIDHGLKNDGVIGNRETWPAMNQALTTRHEGLTRLGDAMAGHRSISGPMGAELKQLNTILAEFGSQAPVRGRDEAPLLTPMLTTRPSGEMVYVNRGSETLTDVSRLFGIPLTALLASNPDIEKPYLILPGQEIVIPKLIKDRFFRKPPRQLHPADPEGYLASSNMNGDFVTRVNMMIEQLRGEGFDVRIVDGFRTFREQQARFEQGRTSSGPIVTNCEAGHSWHNYGLAVDIALNDEDGNPVWPEDSSPFWQRLGDVAISHGVFWGGVFGYPGHIEYHPNYGRDEANHFIEEFEAYGLEGVWEHFVLDLPVSST